MAQPVSSSRDWRRTEEKGPGAKYTSIVFLGLLVVGLTIVLILWLMPKTPPAAGLLVLDVPERDLGLPEIPAARSLPADLLPAATSDQPEPLATAEDVNQLADKLQSLVGADKKLDAAVVLITTYGISVLQYDASLGTQPWKSAGLLLSRDFRFSDDQPMATPAALIEAASRIPAEHKLLLLDTSFLLTDVWYGMGVNEFPYLLEQKVAESDDPNLWVIHATRMMQPSSIIYSASDSETVFSRSVIDALQQLGDQSLGKRGEPISLLQFYRTLLEFTAAYDREQQPVLMRGQQGLLSLAGNNPLQQELDNVVLFERRVAEETEEASEEEAGDKAEDAEGEQTTAAARVGPAAATAASLAWATRNNQPLAVSPHSVFRRAVFPRAVFPRAAFPPAMFPLTSGRLVPRAWLAAARPRVASGRARRLRAAARQEDEPAEQEQTSGAGTGADDASAEQEPAEETTGADAPTAGAPAPSPPDFDEQLGQALERWRGRMTDAGWKWNDLQLELLELHRLVESLENRQRTGGWSPIDFAPAAWRAVRREVAQLDERSLQVQPAAVQFETRLREARRLRSQLEQLRKLMRGESAGANAGDDREAVTQIREAWMTLGRRGLRQSWETDDPREADVIQSLRTYYDLVFRVPFYLRLHEQLSARGTADLSVDLTRLLETLQEQRELFARARFGDETRGFGREARQLRIAADELLAAEDTLRNRLTDLLKRLDRRQTSDEQLIDGLQAQRICFTLLQSPLLPLWQTESGSVASEPELFSRARVLEEFQRVLEQQPPVVAESGNVTLPSGQRFFGEAPEWQRAKGRLDLHWQLLRLVAVDETPLSKAEQAIAAIQIPAQVDRDAVQALLPQFRVATAALRELYESTILDPPRSGSGEPAFALLPRIADSLVDPRDPVRRFNVASDFPQLAFTSQKEPEIVRFAANGEFRFELDQNPAFDWERQVLPIELPVELEGYEEPTLDVSVVAMQTGVFEVLFKGQALQPGSRLEVPVGGQGECVVALEARPLVDRANVPETYRPGLPLLELEARGLEPDSLSMARVALTPPLPRFVDVLIRDLNTRAWEPSSNETPREGQLSPSNGRADATTARDQAFPDAAPIPVVQVKLYPGTEQQPRASAFQLDLVNRSGYPVEASVELFEVVLPLGAGEEGRTGMPLAVLPGRVAPSLSDEPHPDLSKDMLARLAGRKTPAPRQLLAKSGLQLPAATQTWPVSEQVFGTGEEGAPEPWAVPVRFVPDPPAEGEPAPPPPTGDPPQFDLPHGMLCRLTVNGWGDQPQVSYRWIEFEVAAPEDYLRIAKRRDDEEPNLVFRPQERQIVFTTGPQADPKWQAANYPWDFFQAIDISWYLPDDETRYPRRAEPPLAKLVSGAERTSTAWEIPLVEYTEEMLSPLYLNVDGYPRALAYKVQIDNVPRDAVAVPGDYSRNDSKEVRIHRISGLVQDEAKWFSSRLSDEVFWMGECDQVRIDYQIDGPMEAMRTLRRDLLPDDEEYIELEWTGFASRTEFKYFDRALSFTGSTDPKGNLLLQTRVADHSQELQAAELPKNRPISVAARLRLGPERPAEAFQAFGIDVAQPLVREVQTLLTLKDGSRRPLRGGESISLQDTVTLVAIARDEHAGIGPEDVSFYLNPRRVNDQWQYDEATKLGKTDPAMEIADSQWFRFSLELTGQDLGGAVGEFTVVPRVVDRVGNQAEFELEPLVVRVANKEAQAMQEPDRPKSYEIRLKVTVNRNRAVSGEPEFVVNDGAKSVQKIGARDDYVYAIRDLQPGEYKIEASYQAPTGRARTGTLTIKIGPQETNPIIRRVLKLE